MTRRRTRCPVRPFDLLPMTVVDEAKRVFDADRHRVAPAGPRPATGSVEGRPEISYEI